MTMESIAGIGYGGAHQNTRLNRILTELQSQKTEVLAGAGANVAIPVTGIETQDHIISAIMFAAGVPSDISGTTTITDLRASGTLTLAGMVATDAVAVNGKTYTGVTFTPNGSNSGELAPQSFATNGNDTADAAALAAVINANDTAVIATAAAAVVTVRARAAGVGGNAIALVVTASGGHATRSAATLAGGSATNSIRTTVDTTGNVIMLTWCKKSRTVGQT